MRQTFDKNDTIIDFITILSAKRRSLVKARSQDFEMGDKNPWIYILLWFKIMKIMGLLEHVNKVMATKLPTFLR